MPVRTTARPLSSTPRRLRGLLVIAAVVAGSWGAYSLLERQPAVFRHLELHAADGMLQAFVPPPGGGSSARLVLSKTPIRFDPTASLLVWVETGVTRIVPGNAGVILVEADGRFVALKIAPPRALLYYQIPLAAAASRNVPSLATWFASPPVATALRGSPPAVRHFWQ